MPERTQNAPQQAGAAARAGAAVDPYRAYNFKLEIQGLTQAHFTECAGLGVRITPIRYREGGTAPQIIRVLPGPVEYADVTLRYGLTASRELWDWLMAVTRGGVERKNVSILLLDTDGVTEVMRWNLINAWPAEWQGTMLDSMSREVAIESLTLVYESLERG